MTDALAHPRGYVEHIKAPPSVEVMAGRTDITSQPDTVNLNLYRGDDFILTLTVTDQNGEGVDLSGATAEAQIRTTFDGPLAGQFDISISGSVITLHLRAGVSQAIPLRCVWDCRLSHGMITTLVAGTLIQVADVTRPMFDEEGEQ